MPRTPSFLPLETFQRADSLDFSQRADHDIWSLGFNAKADADIHALGRPGTPIPGVSQSQPLVFPEAAPGPEPLPIVVSPRPEIQQPKPPPAASGTPSAMPSAGTPPTLVDATITQGPRPDQQLQPGESVGDITLVSNAGTRASRFAREIAQVAAEEGVPADVLAAILDTENSGETSVSPAGARGLMQVVPGQGFDREGEDASDPLTSIRQGARALKEKYRMAEGDWDLAGRLYFGVGTDAGGVSDNQYHDLYRQNRLKYQGQPAQQQTYPERAGAPQPEARQYGQQSADLYPRQDLLDDPEKWAVCGPLGIMAFAAMKGQPIDYETAKNAARQAGWTAARGMAGPESQVAALNSIGVRAKTGPIDMATITQEVRNGNPVGLSSPGGEGHYFTVQGVDDQGRLDLGNSALSLRASGGRRWFTLDELRQMGAIGNVTTAIYIDNPASPTPSVAADARQSSMNVGAAGSPPAAAPAAPPQAGSAVPPSTAGLPPTVAAKWRQMYGRDPDPQEASELMSMMGVA